jgi:hypothetical protein
MLQKIRMILKEKSDIFQDVVQGRIREMRSRKGNLFKVRLSEEPHLIHPVLEKYINPKSRIFKDQRICVQTMFESERNPYRIEDPYPIGIRKNVDKQIIVDGLWQQLKRMVMGVCHFVSSAHFHRYVYEALFRQHHRNQSNEMRFDIVMNRTNHIIPYRLVSPKNI